MLAVQRADAIELRRQLLGDQEGNASLEDEVALSAFYQLLGKGSQAGGETATREGEIEESIHCALAN